MLSTLLAHSKKWLNLTRGAEPLENTQFPNVWCSWSRIRPAHAPTPCSSLLASSSSLGLPKHGLGSLLSVLTVLHSHPQLPCFSRSTSLEDCSEALSPKEFISTMKRTNAQKRVQPCVGRREAGFRGREEWFV